MLNYLNAFDEFNPLTQPLPSGMRWTLQYMVQEATFLLPADFKEIDLNAGLEILHQLRRYSPSVIEDTISVEMADRKLDEIHLSPVKTCFNATKYLEEPVDRHGGVYRWSQVFAVGALASVSDCVTSASNIPEDRYLAATNKLLAELKDFERFSNPSFVAALPVTAMESIGYARLFLNREQGNPKRSKGASTARLEPYHPLKLAIVNHFNGLPADLSVRKAARIIWSALPEKLKRLSVSEDPHQQVESWLGQYKKGTLPGQKDLPPCHPKYG